MSKISALRAVAAAAAMAKTRVREKNGECPPPGTIHGRNYQSLRAAYAAFNLGDRPAALEALSEVADWEWVDAKFRFATFGMVKNVRRGQLRSYLTDLVSDGDLAHAGHLSIAATAVLDDHFKNL